MLIIQPNGVSPTSCFGSKNKGCAVTKQRMSHWLVEAISLAYEACGLASPLGVRAHSTKAWLCRKPSLVDLLWMIYVLWQDGPHRALLSNSKAWILKPFRLTRCFPRIPAISGTSDMMV